MLHYSVDDYFPAVHAEENAVINVVKNGNYVIESTLYLYGIDVKTNKPVAGMPCPGCKRVLINAGTKEVVAIDESGNLTKYDVKSWVEEDKNRYLDVVEKVKKELTI